MDADSIYTIAIALFSVGFGTVIINLILIGLMLKMYTEIFKARDQDKRKELNRRGERGDW